MSHDAEHAAHSCHWSVPTLLMPWPYWTSALDSPWSCWNYRAVAVLRSTEGCQHCPMWRPRQVVHGEEGAIPPVGAVPMRMRRSPR